MKIPIKVFICILMHINQMVILEKVSAVLLNKTSNATNFED